MKDLPPQKRKALVQCLLVWYDKSRRRLPWRPLPGQSVDPYRVWLSEIMLQQTTVAAVGPYFQSFVKRWPTMNALAAAPVDEIMSAWSGLGYYSRARNLHACAMRVAAEYGGSLPNEEAELKALPGIGPYTAAAIAAIAFGKQTAPVDGNIERVLARLFAVREKLPAAKPMLRSLAQALAPQSRAGDFAQAMMDLGATICTPKSPTCESCPWIRSCAAKKLGVERSLPARSTKKLRPLRRGAAFVVISGGSEILLRRRPPKGLLGGMHETPMSAWEKDFPGDPLSLAPTKSRYRMLDGLVHHTFTHFNLELQVFISHVNSRQSGSAKGEWAPVNDLAHFALPSVIRKIIEHALNSAERKNFTAKARRAPR